MATEYGNGRDFISAAKINYFHYVLKQLTGYTLHPSINVSARPCRIADLGTQTAIWPTDIAEDTSLPTDVDGFDISDKFFPPRAWLPSNVSLHLHDIYKAFPERFSGKFDVVHLRLFLTLATTQVTQILQNATKLLKPGGYIQWTEHDKTAITPIAASHTQPTTAAQAFIDLEQNPFPNYNARYDPSLLTAPLITESNSSWVLDIAPMMASAGLQVVAHDRMQVRRSLLMQLNELHLLSLMDVPTGLSEAVDLFRERHLEGLVDEYCKGVSTVDGFVCVVGKRPEA